MDLNSVLQYEDCKGGQLTHSRGNCNGTQISHCIEGIQNDCSSLLDHCVYLRIVHLRGLTAHVQPTLHLPIRLKMRILLKHQILVRKVLA